MGNLALVLTDIVLIIVALGGGIFTLVRARRVGGLAVGLAGTACVLLVLASIIDLVWWTVVFPAVLEDDGYTTITPAHAIISSLGWVLTVVAIGLLFGAANAGRSPAAGSVATPAPAAPGGFAMPAATPSYGPVGTAHRPVSGAPAAPAAQPAQGWTPPQQTQPDWNIHSGVWSIPRGTFDGPPPDHQNHR